MPSASRGVPVTKTRSPNATVMFTSESAACAPGPSGEVTPVTAGSTPSAETRAEPVSDSGEPGAGRARSASLPAASRTVPPPAVRAPLPAYSRVAAVPKSPSSTVYANASSSVPLPPAYSACRPSPSPPRTSSARRGELDTNMDSLASTTMRISRSGPYAPSGDADATACTNGAALSILAFEAPRERGEPGMGRVRFAGLPASSARTPPGIASESVPVYPRRAAAGRSPPPTAYTKVSVAVSFPPAYAAVPAAAPPMSSARDGAAPENATGSSKLTRTAIDAPSMYAASRAVTPRTRGGEPSARTPAAASWPGGGSTRETSAPSRPAIRPPPADSEPVPA